MRALYVKRQAWRRPILALGVALAPFGGLAAQELSPGGGAAPVAVLRSAEEAQGEFEGERIRWLPWARAEPGRPCEEIVGRFCYWNEEGGGWSPRPEDSRIAAARERLLGRIEAAAAALPSDGWLAGQHVRYLVEAGRAAEAVRLARSCRADPAWCRALEGYALHAAGDFTAAELAFDSALALMRPGERRQWSDVELLLEPQLARAWRRMGEEARVAFARRLWWLADPLWSVPGNERRTEHFARLVLDGLQERARSPYDVRWGADLKELTVRYGWPVGWERVRPRLSALGDGGRPNVVGHDPPGARSFVPPLDVFAAPEVASPAAWPLDPPAPRSIYAPAYADSIVELPHQLAVFRRGRTAHVVAGFDLGGDDATSEAVAALVIATTPDAPPAVAHGTAPRGALRVEFPWEAGVASIEVLSGRRAGRARYGLDLPLAPPAVSDILLLDRTDPLPSSLGEAATIARPTTVVVPGERLGVFFEIYPPAGTAVADVAIALRAERGGFWRRLAGAFGADRPEGGVALAWSEEIAADTAVHPRALVLTLPDLSPGHYTLLLEVELDGDAATRVERPFEVR